MAEIIIQIKAVVPDGKEHEILERITDYLGWNDEMGKTRMEYLKYKLFQYLKECNRSRVSQIFDKGRNTMIEIADSEVQE
jgi:hypothetical protein